MPELKIAGRPVRVSGGVTVLAALHQAEMAVTRISLRGQPRGPLCGMGVCFECRARVNGVLVRTCMTTVQDGMTVELEVPHDRAD